MEIEYGEIVINGRKLIAAGSLCIKENAINVISAPNGVGKTLLIKQLFYSAISKQDVTMVGQGFGFFSNNLDIVSNVSLSDNPIEVERCKELLAKLGLQEEIFTHSGKELSGGENRLLSIARGICHTHKGGILFLDEPTNDLDINAVNLIKVALLEMSELATIVIVSHDSRILSVSDNTFVVKGKQVVNVAIDEKNDANNSTANGIVEGADYITKKAFFLKMLGSTRTVIAIHLSLCLISVFFAYLHIIPEFHNYPNMNPNEILIYTPNSVIASEYMMGGAIPISGVGLINADAPVNDKTKEIKQIDEHLATDQIVYGLDDSSTDEYEAFVIEVIDVRNFVFHNVLEYADDRLSTEEVINSVSADGNDMRKRGYEQEDGYYNTCVLIRQRDANYLTLGDNEIVRKHINGNYYIVSRETIAFKKQITSLSKKSDAIKSCLLLMLLMLVVNMLTIIMSLLRSRRVIGVFRDIGCDFKDVVRWEKDRYHIKRARRIMLSSVLICISTIQILLETPLVIGNYITLLFLTVALCLSRFMTDKLINIYTRRFFSWRYRW